MTDIKRNLPNDNYDALVNSSTPATAANPYTTAADVVFHKFDGTTNPKVTDDSGDGFVVGSRWVDTTNDKAYVCVNNALGAAIWKQVASTSGVQVSATDLYSSGGTNIPNYVSNELTIRSGVAAGPAPLSSSVSGTFIIPDDYASGGSLTFHVRRDGAVNSHTATAWINDTVDSTINVSSIIATADVTWESKTLVFGDALVGGNRIDVELNASTENNEYSYIKGWVFKYNK